MRDVAQRIVRLRNNKFDGLFEEVTSKDETDMRLCVRVAEALRKRADPIHQRMDVDWKQTPMFGGPLDVVKLKRNGEA